MANLARTLLDGFQALVMEPGCAACDLLLRHAERPCGFCHGCLSLLEPAGKASRPPAATAALYLYGGPLATALQRLKYEGRSELSRPLGQLMAHAAAAYAGRVDAVVPMPLHGSRLRQRGYNQAALLGRPLARALGVPLRSDLIRRQRATDKQADLNHGDRVANVRGAFAARPGMRPLRLLLVDDVRTSGATLAEAAGVLRAGGHSDVRTLALAFAQR